MIGEIKDFPLPEVVQIISQSKKTGLLEIDGATTKVSIDFYDGVPTKIDSSGNYERLGELLLKDNRITRRDVINALVIQNRIESRNGWKRIGIILVNMGAVDEGLVKDYVKEQIRISLHTVLSECSGSFRFDANVRYDIPVEKIEISIDEILINGFGEIEELALAKSHIKSLLNVPKRNSDVDEPMLLRLNNDERLLLSLVNGKRNYGEIKELSRLPDYVFYRILLKAKNKLYINKFS